MNDGGPAFPAIEYMADRGMSLRDYFAAAALTGILSNRAASLGPIDSSEFAHDAYVVADDMLTERAQK